MTRTAAREALTAAIAARSALVALAESLTGRKASAAWSAVADADVAVGFAAREIEFAVRAENPGADEATIQMLTRAA